MANVLAVVCIAASVLLIVCVLLHRGSGGGLSDMFGSAGADAAGSAQANKNLTRLTVTTALVWTASLFALAALAR